MNVRIFWVRVMKCMCAQTRPRFILSSEGVFGGMEFEPMLTPREKSPLPLNVPRGGSNPRHRGQWAQALPTELFRPPRQWLQNWLSSDYLACTWWYKTSTRTGSPGISTFCFVLFVGCLSSQQHASVSQGQICSDNFTCCHTEIEAADQTFHLTQSQYTDTGPTSPSADPITPGAWQGSHWSANF